MVSAKDDWYIGQSRYFFADQFKILPLIRNGDVAQITDTYIAQPYAVFAEGCQMSGPETDPLRAERRACARACSSIVRNANHREIGFRWRKIRAMQISPKSMSCRGVHASSFFRYCISCHLLKPKRTVMLITARSLRRTNYFELMKATNASISTLVRSRLGICVSDFAAEGSLSLTNKTSGLAEKFERLVPTGIVQYSELLAALLLI